MINEDNSRGVCRARARAADGQLFTTAPSPPLSGQRTLVVNRTEMKHLKEGRGPEFYHARTMGIMEKESRDQLFVTSSSPPNSRYKVDQTAQKSTRPGFSYFIRKQTSRAHAVQMGWKEAIVLDPSLLTPLSSSSSSFG